MLTFFEKSDLISRAEIYEHRRTEDVLLKEDAIEWERYS